MERVSWKILAKQDLDEELYEYCPLPEESQGVHNYGGLPVMCEGVACHEAYENYIETTYEEVTKMNKEKLRTWSYYNVIVIRKEDLNVLVDTRVIAKDKDMAAGLAGVPKHLEEAGYDKEKLAITVNCICAIRPEKEGE